MLNESVNSYRHEWISVAAYYKAELRCFKPGKALDDWLEAESEYTDFKIQSFLLRCQEDGGMTLLDLQGLADSVGIDHAEGFNSRVDLIREIQKASCRPPCFHAGTTEPCKDLTSECHWREECLKLIAIWQR